MNDSFNHLLSKDPSFPDKVKLQPQNIIILTDGVYISSCIMFTKFASQKKLGSTLNLGNVIYNLNNSKSVIGNACSENVFKLDDIYINQEILKSNCTLPANFERAS